VSVENEDIGYLPGNMIIKMDPWTRPIIDIFNEFYSLSDIQNLIKNGVIEICPLAYMRGRTFHRTYLLADEMQNSSPNQMKMLTTRIGNDSKFVIMGDIAQSDLNIKDGLYDFVERYEKKKVKEIKKRICIIKMEIRDIQRSKVVSDVLEIYKEDEKDKEEKMKERKKEIDNIQKLRLWGREYPF
jgi:phosphate starvation-inducible PhoH-like protein